MVLAATTGAKNALKVIVNFPGIYLISAFSFWMVGPKSERCCSFESEEIGISFCLTWFNVFLTIAGSLIFLFTSGLLGVDFNLELMAFILLVITCLAFAVFSVIPFMLLDQCTKCCCKSESCCMKNCYPAIEITYLPISYIDELELEVKFPIPAKLFPTKISGSATAERK